MLLKKNELKKKQQKKTPESVRLREQLKQTGASLKHVSVNLYTGKIAILMPQSFA